MYDEAIITDSLFKPYNYAKTTGFLIRNGLQNSLYVLNAAYNTNVTVRRLHFVDAVDLPQLYAGAAVFAYPSVYEGFGLPVLEAMASGVKVICARDAAMAEFSFNSACINDPSSCDELAFALQRELESTASGQPVENQASLFTWQACAKKTLAIYQQIQ